MKLLIFSAESVNEILESAICQNKRGYKKQLSEAAQCQPSHLSQVLAGSVYLTIDQAFAVTKFLMLLIDETRFFLLLVQRDRSGTRELRKYYSDQINTARSEQLVLANRIEVSKNLEEYREEYYSSWFHSAIHIGLTIPKFRDPKVLAGKLRIAISLVLKSIELLQKMKLIENFEGVWRTVAYNVHVSNRSPFWVANHLNWRAFFSQRIQEKQELDVSYTAVHSLSKTDVEKLRNLVINFIEDSRNLVEPSKEEELVSVGLDFCCLSSN